MDLQIHNLISRTNFPKWYIIFSTFTFYIYHLGKHNCITGSSLSIFYITINFEKITIFIKKKKKK